MPQHDDAHEGADADMTESTESAGSTRSGDATGPIEVEGTGPTEVITSAADAASAGPIETSTGRSEPGTDQTLTDTGRTEPDIGRTDSSTWPTEASTWPTEAITGPTEAIDSEPSTTRITAYDSTASAPFAPGVSAASYGATATTGPDGTSPRTPSGSAPWSPTPPARPRVRVGAIVWGVLVAAFAAAVIAVSASPDARSAFDAWQASLTPAAWAVIGVVALGVAVLLIAVTSAIRSAQRRAQALDRG
ncbi:hypothetical protein GCM10028798_24450 [Humibacter antri]